MRKVEEIEEQIQSLSREEFAELRDWFIEQDWKAWDAQVAADAASPVQRGEPAGGGLCWNVGGLANARGTAAASLDARGVRRVAARAAGTAGGLT